MRDQVAQPHKTTVKMILFLYLNLYVFR